VNAGDGPVRIRGKTTGTFDRDPSKVRVPPGAWSSFCTSVVLDLAAPEVIEICRIAAEQDTLTEVEPSLSGPPLGWYGSDFTNELGLDVLYGGLLTSSAGAPRPGCEHTESSANPATSDSLLLITKF
jgi:hypothetical protein